MASINLKKKITLQKPLPKKKSLFEADSDEETQNGTEAIGEFDFDGLPASTAPSKPAKSSSKPTTKPTLKPLSQKPTGPSFGNLSSAFESKKHADTAESLDTNIYEYDSVYDSLKPSKSSKDVSRSLSKPSTMTSLLAAAAIRKRDALVAEEKRLLREREAEGDEYADKEKFVTSAYKLQQAENRRIEEEERLREAAEEKKNEGKGLQGFYKQMLEKREEEHAAVVAAVEEKIKNGKLGDEDEVEKEKTAADLARELNEREGRKIAINDNGEVVDERDLLKGGLNTKARPKDAAQAPARAAPTTERAFVGSGGGKKAQRERQTRMMEAQLEQATKRALEQDEEEMAKVERAAKSQKTEGDIMSAKERYLARKREAEEAKKRGDIA